MSELELQRSDTYKGGSAPKDISHENNNDSGSEYELTFLK